MRIFRRTVFRIGRSDQCHTTKTLKLFFDYDSKPKALRERFSLREARLTPTKELMDSYRKGGDGARQLVNAYERALRSPDRKASSELSILWTVIYKADRKVAKSAIKRHMVERVKKEWYPGIGFIEERVLRPNWKRELGLALREPAKSVMTLLLEDLTGESDEGVERITESVAKVVRDGGYM
ncbi:hypothetical protein P7C70_g4659, partial [Phenoliferia sp. Uapishka_3]